MKIKHLVTTRVWDKKTDTTYTIPVALTIDLDKLARALGHKAYRSKSGVATALYGAVVGAIKKT